MLLKYNGNVNRKRENGTTPIFQAAKNRHADLCIVILTANTKVNEQRNHNEIIVSIYIAANNVHVDAWTRYLTKLVTKI